MLSYFEEGGGGVVTHVKNLVTRITKHSDIDLHIVTIGGNKNRVINQYGATIHFIKEVNIRAAQYVYYPLLLRKKILEINPDIIHVQGVGTSYSVALMLIKEYPTVLTLHGNIIVELKYRLTSSLKIFIKIKIDGCLERQLLKRVSHVIVLSPAFKEHVSILSDSKIHIIPNGINVAHIQNIQPFSYTKHHSILFVGRLEKGKRCRHAVKSNSPYQKINT